MARFFAKAQGNSSVSAKKETGFFVLRSFFRNFAGENLKKADGQRA